MQALDIYDDIPRDQRAYLANYGWHFSEKACQYAVSQMKRIDRKTKVVEPLSPWTKAEIDNMLITEGVKVENKIMYDYVFVANMAKADFLGSSLEDMHHVAKYIRDYVDDVDAQDGFVFRRWYATMVGDGKPVNWKEML